MGVEAGRVVRVSEEPMGGSGRVRKGIGASRGCGGVVAVATVGMLGHSPSMP